MSKVAEGAISSQSSSSRHHVVQKTEDSNFHPQCALRTVPVYSSSVFSASVPAAVVPHADPPPLNVWALGSVTNQHASAAPSSDFVGVCGANQAVAKPLVVPPITAIPFRVPPQQIPVFLMPALTVPAQPLLVTPTGKSTNSRSDTIGGAAPVVGS